MLKSFLNKRVIHIKNLIIYNLLLIWYFIVQPTKKSRAELMREIDAEYYGYLDDGENLLIETEENCEKISK